MMRVFPNILTNPVNLDQFISDAVQWAANDWESFLTHWKYKDVLKMLPKYRGQIDGALMNTLDMTNHSLPYSYLLGFKSTEKFDDPQQISLYLNQINTFISNCDPNKSFIHLYPRPFNDSLKYLLEYFKKADKNASVRLIPILKRAIRLLQGRSNNNLLTMAHGELMFCCVDSYNYHLAFPEISQDLIQVQGYGCVRSIDNLRYHYFASLVYIGLKQFNKAMESLVMCCTSPSEAISCIQIEAYKKYILICLIRKQKFISLPKYTPRILTRYFPKFCSEYLEISNSFNQGINVVSKLIEKNAELYIKDHNFGLVKQVLVALEKNAVKKLTSVYTRLSIKKVNELCGFDSIASAKNILILMIKNNELSASIDKDGVVTFDQSNNISLNDKELLINMQQRIKYVLDLWNSLDSQQLDIKTSKKYVLKTLNLPNTENESAQQMLLQSMMGSMGGFRHGM